MGSLVGVIGVIVGVAAGDLSAQVDAASGADRKPEPALRIQGSDTMLQVNLTFAKAYSKQHPMKGVEVEGMGSSVGFKALLEGEADIACSSRPIKDSEKARIKTKRGEDPVGHVVAYDVIAVFVHAKNRLEAMSLETLKQAYFQGGKIERWDQVPDAQGSMGDIELVGRSASSGTYAAFSQAVAGASSRYKAGISAMAGSAALVEKVGSSPQAIGYASPKYATKAVKMLKLAAKEGDQPVAPVAESIRSGKYPLARKLYFYTAGAPQGEVKAFIDWLSSEPAREIIQDQGFIAP